LSACPARRADYGAVAQSLGWGWRYRGSGLGLIDEIVKRVQRLVARYPYARMRDFPQLCERLREMRQEGLNAAQMADQLNQEGFSPPKRSNPFSEELVRQLLCRQGISNEKTCSPSLAAHEWWLPDLARELKMPARKLRGWIERGWLYGRQTPAQHLWIVWADRDEMRRLRKLVARSHRGVTSQPRELTTPKNRR